MCTLDCNAGKAAVSRVARFVVSTTTCSQPILPGGLSIGQPPPPPLQDCLYQEPLSIKTLSFYRRVQSMGLAWASSLPLQGGVVPGGREKHATKRGSKHRSKSLLRQESRQFGRLRYHRTMPALQFQRLTAEPPSLNTAKLRRQHPV